MKHVTVTCDRCGKPAKDDSHKLRRIDPPDAPDAPAIEVVVNFTKPSADGDPADLCVKCQVEILTAFIAVLGMEP